jgi:hypothetical protein
MLSHVVAGHRRTRWIAAVAAFAVAGSTAPAGAQWLKAPVLVFQPGIVTANAISAPEIDVLPGPGLRRGHADAASGLNVRFTMVVPTASPAFNLVFGTQFQPNGLDGNDDNRPGFYYGAILPLNFIGDVSRGWLSLSIDPLGVYGPNPIAHADGSFPYSHEFVLEGAFVLNIGSKMMASMGPWSGLGVYFLYDQLLTHAPREVDGNHDYFSPVLLYGLTLPIAPWGK